MESEIIKSDGRDDGQDDDGRDDDGRDDELDDDGRNDTEDNSRTEATSKGPERDEETLQREDHRLFRRIHVSFLPLMSTVV